MTLMVMYLQAVSLETFLDNHNHLMLMIKINRVYDKNVSNMEKLQNTMKDMQLDYYMISTLNEWGMFDLNDLQSGKLFRLTNFSGSNGIAFICCAEHKLPKHYLLTDSRYVLQAQKELGADWFVITRTEDLPVNMGRIGYDSMNFSCNMFMRYKHNLENDHKAVLCAIDGGCVENDFILEHTGSCFILPEIYCGISAREKLLKMKFASDHILISSPMSICWLLNIRGTDLDNTPVFLAYLLLDKHGEGVLYVDKTKIENALYEYLDDLGIEVQELAVLYDNYHSMCANHTVSIDPETIACWFNNEYVRHEKDQIVMMRAIKNLTERKGFIEAHKRDGRAVSEFIMNMKGLLNDPKHMGNDLSEFAAAQYLFTLRKKYGKREFVGDSFAAISAYKGNGAIVHYHASKNNADNIVKDGHLCDGGGLYLIDSGGQYFMGTTDVTRTIALCKPSIEQKKRFTQVLRGHIAMASMKIPEGTCGSHIDAIARLYLWNDGVDYGHATGHGVGSFLSVHEGPHAISSRSDVPLQAGMVVSIEPGYYKKDSYGIRCENLYLIEESEFEHYLHFRCLTFVPFDDDLIIWEELSCEDKLWLERYNEEVKQNMQKTE